MSRPKNPQNPKSPYYPQQYCPDCGVKIGGNAKYCPKHWKRPIHIGKNNESLKNLKHGVEEFNASWKGDKAQIPAIRSWVKERLGKATKCSNPYCKFSKKKRPKRIEWVNKSRKFLRDVNDWAEMCPSCRAKMLYRKLSYEDFCGS